jgi:hypothetical protein
MNTGEDIALYPAQYYLLDADQKSRFIGVYPKEGVYSATDKTVTYPELDGAIDVMCSNIAVGHKDIDTNPELTFKHLLTKIKVQLKVDGANDDEKEEVINTWGEVSSIKVVGKKTGAVVTLPAPGSTGEASIATTGGTPGDLELTTKDGKTPASLPLSLTLNDNSDPFGYAMFVPSTAEEKLTLTIGFDDGRTVAVQTPTDQKYEVGKGYKIVVAFEKGEPVPVVITRRVDQWDNNTQQINKPALIETVTPQPATKTLDGLSNAYIVAPGDSVTFTVSRAYEYDDEHDVFTTTLRTDPNGLAYTDGFETKVVWADFNTDTYLEIPPVTGSGKNAVVTVKAKTGASGNAVVKIYKKYDSSETPVWSYHIWVTDYDPENTLLQYKNPNNDVVFMNRNLGAKEAGYIYNTNNAGLYYQWGRKDPFPTEGDPGDGLFTAEETDGTKGTVEWAIQHPGTFLTGFGDWLSSPDPNLWGHGGDKSIYDPCPSGWRVPVHGGTEDTSPWEGFTTSNGGVFSDGYNWDTNAKYPAAGGRNQESGALLDPGTHGSYWSAASSDEDASHLYFYNGTVEVASVGSRAYGVSVRCVRE